MLTLPWIIGSGAIGVLAGPRIRAVVFSRGVESGRPPRDACPGCARRLLPVRYRWRATLPASGRCPECQARIGPYPLLAELTTAGALAIVAARASSPWELAALAWLTLLAVPLAFIDVAAHRLPNPLTATAFIGTLGVIAVTALAAHQPGHLAGAVIGAAVLACFYLVLWLIRPDGMGLGDAKLAASVGLVLGWTGWEALLTGTFVTFLLAAGYGGALLVTGRARRNSQLPLGPFILVSTLATVAFMPFIAPAG